ncbi:hypothetical protein [Chitinophaga caseinilytica]|uniref:Uncharacterized protein n=1 Tax=Chitinophaga caseinilytica TaxID=2267521 RepID=A0ABZ2YZH6_9BACT
MKVATHIFLIVAAGFLFFITLVISPYKYEWEPELKQLDEDSVVFLWFVYGALTPLLMVGFFVARRYKQAISWVYVLLLLVAVWRMISLWLVK